jgi:GT2 family glycosyltransferase
VNGKVWRFVRDLPLAILAPVMLLVSAVVLWIADLVFFVLPRTNKPADTRPRTDAASIVIPNWNGRDLLAKYLPSVIGAAERLPGCEIIVVDNGSEDGSAQFLLDTFPQVRVVALPRNLGFGSGSNAGFRAATHDIVVLLNSDMRVEADFLAPLLAGFTDPQVFSVACQIFFSDPAKVREETGLTEGWWLQGGLRVRHRVEPEIRELYPCFYGGGGS